MVSTPETRIELHKKKKRSPLTRDTAAAGFTKEHMESFIHLGTYALGALSNQHGLAPDAPHPDGQE